MGTHLIRVTTQTHHYLPSTFSEGESIPIDQLPARLRMVPNDGSKVTVEVEAGSYHLSQTLQFNNLNREVEIIGPNKQNSRCVVTINSLRNLTNNDLSQRPLAIFNNEDLTIPIDEQWAETPFRVVCPPFRGGKRPNAARDIMPLCKRNTDGTIHNEWQNILFIETLEWSGQEVQNLLKCSFSFFRATANKQSYTQVAPPTYIGAYSYLMVYVKWLAYSFRVESTNNQEVIVRRTDTTENGKVLHQQTGYLRVLNPVRQQTTEALSPSFSYAATQLQLHGLNHSNAHYQIGQLRTLVRLNNCSKISFKRIAFMGNALSDFTETGNMQAQGSTSGAILSQNSRNISFSDCEFSALYGYCVSTREGEENNNQFQLAPPPNSPERTRKPYNFPSHTIRKTADLTLSHCYVHDTFGGGFRISDSSDRNQIDHNLIFRFGRYQAGAVAILIQTTRYCRVEYNHIFNGAYTGISVGWTWSPNCIVSYGHEIAYNLIDYCFNSPLSDGAGIYTLGIQPNTNIHHNYIRNIRGNGLGSPVAGIYLDESSDLISVKHNVVDGATYGFYLNAPNSSATITDNLLINTDNQVIWIPEGAQSITCKLNRMSPKTEGKLYRPNAKREEPYYAQNLVLSPTHLNEALTKTYRDVTNRWPKGETLQQWTPNNNLKQ